MSRGAPIAKLKAWRVARGLSLEEAAARVVVDGEPCTKSTWYGWEQGKVPKPDWMHPLCDLTGLEPNDFYPRADGRVFNRGAASGGTNGDGGSSGPKGGNGSSEPPQMAFAI